MELDFIFFYKMLELVGMLHSSPSIKIDSSPFDQLELLVSLSATELTLSGAHCRHNPSALRECS